MERDLFPSTTVLRMPAASCAELCNAMTAVAGLRNTRNAQLELDEGLRPVGEPWIDRPLVVSTLERLLTPDDEVVDIGRLFSRCATLIQLASPTIGMFRTSVPAIFVERRAAAALAAVVREIAHVAERCVRPSIPLRLYLAIEWNGAQLVVALACPEAAATPVPSAGAAVSLAAAQRIAAAAGGSLVRGVREGTMVFAVMLDWVETRSAGGGRGDA